VYGTPTLPLLNEPLRLSGGARTTVIVTSLVKVAPVLSTIVTWKVKAPAVVGVPERTQLAKVVPGGRLPLGVQRYGPTPPVAVKVMAMGAPVETGVVGPPVMFSGAGWMVMLKTPPAGGAAGAGIGRAHDRTPL